MESFSITRKIKNSNHKINEILYDGSFNCLVKQLNNIDIDYIIHLATSYNNETK